MKNIKLQRSNVNTILTCLTTVHSLHRVWTDEGGKNLDQVDLVHICTASVPALSLSVISMVHSDLFILSASNNHYNNNIQWY